jgi:glycosyltransferase involved in cell wall biosynthesis
VFANSQRTRHDLIEQFSLNPDRVHTVYLAADAENTPITPEERASARGFFGMGADSPLVLFIGALGLDRRKGLDTLLAAWERLSAIPDWDGQLLVAGGGRGLAYWQERVRRCGLSSSVRLLGFVENVPRLLAAADLLVSPVRYEAYGLNVHESICRGVPAMVSACAGIAERYPAEQGEMLLPDPEDAKDLAARLRAWRSCMEKWKQTFAPLSATLRSYTWDDMAARIVALAEEHRLTTHHANQLDRNEMPSGFFGNQI